MFRIICSIAFAFALFLAFSVLADAANEHLILYFSFDEDLGDEVKDSSQYDHEANFLNGAKWSPDGQYGGGAEIRVPNAHIEIPFEERFSITETITMEVWVNFDVLNKVMLIVEKGKNYNFFFTNTSELRTSDDSGNGIETAGYDFEVEKWYHIAAVQDTVTPQRLLYVDGELVVEDKSAFDLPASDNVTRIGGTAGWAGGNYVGLIDEMRIWNVVRTAKDIQRDMELGPEAVFAADKLATTWGKLKDD